VASFHATLEEVCRADLLLHVVDISAADMWQQVEAVAEVLTTLGAHEKPTIVVLNKADRLEGGDQAVASLQESPLFHNRFQDFVVISALHKVGMADLKAHIAACMERSEVTAVVRTHAGNGKLLAHLSHGGRVLGTEYAGEEAIVRLRIPPKRLAKVQSMGGRYTIETDAKVS
jgi:GTP-binding protein HflX